MVIHILKFVSCSRDLVICTRMKCLRNLPLHRSFNTPKLEINEDFFLVWVMLRQNWEAWLRKSKVWSWAYFCQHETKYVHMYVEMLSLKNCKMLLFSSPAILNICKASLLWRQQRLYAALFIQRQSEMLIFRLTLTLLLFP